MFQYLKNLSTTQTFNSITPYNFTEKRPDFETKDEFRRWCMSPETAFYFYSLNEGINAGVRIGKENPCYKMHGLVVDYDCVIKDRNELTSRVNPSYPPSFISSTFSGGIRLVWEFEEPIFFYNNKVHKALIQRLAKELKLSKLFPGLDEKALFNPAQVFECGTDWMSFKNAEPISSNALSLWLYESAPKQSFDLEGTSIPIELVAAEVEKQFPGRWDGSFEVGARGKRFWDASSDNDTGVIIRETGVQCFTGPVPFMPWSQIFGPTFVDTFKADRIGRALQGLWYDGRLHYRKLPDGLWRGFSKEDIKHWMRHEFGIDSSLDKSGGSEMDAVFCQIQDTRMVDAAVPFVFRKEELVYHNGRRCLNTNRRFVIPPAPEGSVKFWGDGYPMTAKIIASLFRLDNQLDYWISHQKHAYESAYKGNPMPGQAVFLAGPSNSGKTLLTTFITKHLMGGGTPASRYLMSESNFNKELLEVGVWNIDDNANAATNASHDKFSSLVKSSVANDSFSYEPKNKDAVDMPWNGRVYVTLNDDPESIRMIPNTEASILDKIMLFKTSDKDFVFPPKDILEAILIAEAPFYARGLLDYQIPDHIISESPRFKVNCYHHPELLAASRSANPTSGFGEIVAEFRDMMNHFKPGLPEWIGTCAKFKTTASVDQGLKDMLFKYDASVIGRTFGKLSLLKQYGVRQGRSTNKGQEWIIDLVLKEDMDVPF